jgi:predicted RNase H-like nuclease
MHRFLGLDLAWHDSGKTSALAVLEGNRTRVELVRVFEALQSDDDIVDAIAASAHVDATLAIDGPLIICNAIGQRECETAIGRRFGHADASAHTTNLTRFPNARSISITNRLSAAGWGHFVDPGSERERSGQWMFEVYPHPAHVVLFDLQRIIKYKKGTVARRRAGLIELRNAIVNHLGGAEPSLVTNALLRELVDRQLGAVRGGALKIYEDTLDALLCAFVGAHYWAWGAERNEMIGTMAGGYIVTPSRTVGGYEWSFRRPTVVGGGPVTMANGASGREAARVDESARRLFKPSIDDRRI